MNALVLALSGLLSVTSALYSASDDVVQLTPTNFDDKVLGSDDFWIIEFYAPWCGHCQALTAEWKKAATALKGVVKVGAVDADAHGQLGSKYGVRGFPTIKMFGLNKNKPEDYQGGRTAQAFVEMSLNKAKSMVMDRLGGKRGSGGGRSGGGSGGSKTGGGDPKDVIELTDSNFEELVLESDDLWMVEFFAPWCGHCKNLAPHWQSAATQMKGKVKFGAVDATVHPVYASRYGVQGYPTIKMFPAGKKDGEASEYDGGRTASDIVSWVTDKVAENIPPPEIYEVTSQDVIKENCEDHQICVVAFLPHILDCQSKCRNKYLGTLKELGARHKKKQWGYVWSEAGAQPDLEQALEIGGFGYPAMAAVNSRKKLFVMLKGPFSEKGIDEFLTHLAYGKGSSALLKNPELPKVQTSEKWDGKDGEMPVEEDIDLSDVELDDIDMKDEL